MNYAMLIYENAAGFDVRSHPEKGPVYMGAWTAYSRALVEAGIMRGGSGLNVPETATTVVIDQGKHVVQDGPFADTREQLGGFYLIEVDSLDAALEWAAKMPLSLGGSVEVRPALAPPAL